MHSFTLTAIGNLTRNPELFVKGDRTYAKLCLIGSDTVGKSALGEEGEITTSIWFTAFGVLGETLARCARKGDQLIIEAQVLANNWVDKDGARHYDYDFIVQGFRFGAPGKLKRDELRSRASGTEVPPAS